MVPYPRGMAEDDVFNTTSGQWQYRVLPLELQWPFRDPWTPSYTWSSVCHCLPQWCNHPLHDLVETSTPFQRGTQLTLMSWVQHQPPPWIKRSTVNGVPQWKGEKDESTNMSTWMDFPESSYSVPNFCLQQTHASEQAGAPHHAAAMVLKGQRLPQQFSPLIVLNQQYARPKGGACWICMAGVYLVLTFHKVQQ